jgi:hypothetical protein
MRDLFATTREIVRAHIQACIAQMESERVFRGSTGLTGARDLPLIGPVHSGASGAPSAPSTVGENSRSRASTVAQWIGVLGALLAVAAIASSFAFPRSRVAPASPPADPPRAHAWIDTTPAGALVEWNGKKLGLTPTEVSLEPGFQSFAISRDGYEPEVLTMEVRPGDSFTRSLVLRAKPSAAPVVSVVKAKPPVHVRASPPPATAAVPASATLSSKVDAAAPRPRIQMIDENEAP